MGCDYYIYKYLEIEHTRGISYYTLEQHQRGWYDEIHAGCDDSDDEDETKHKACENLWNAVIQYHLTPKAPIPIMENGCFVTDTLREKYEPILRDKILKRYIGNAVLYEDTGVLTQLSEIIRVTKKEIRYTPGNGPPFYSTEFDEENEEPAE